jgi:hypothetical protein
MYGIIWVIGNFREGDWGQTHRLLTELLVESIGRGPRCDWFRYRRLALRRPVAAPARHRQVTVTNPFWRALRHQRCAAVLGHVAAAFDDLKLLVTRS